MRCATALLRSVDRVPPVENPRSQDFRRFENGIPQRMRVIVNSRLRRVERLNLTAYKGRPPPGGEEARVVVYQPRGVGLMHTQHKPSNAHYTHPP
jgi:hypothetical protein